MFLSGVGAARRSTKAAGGDTEVLKLAAALAQKRKGQVRIPLLRELLSKLPGWSVSEPFVDRVKLSSNDDYAASRRAGVRFSAPLGKGESWKVYSSDAPFDVARDKLLAVGQVGTEGAPKVGRFYYGEIALRQPSGYASYLNLGEQILFGVEAVKFSKGKEPYVLHILPWKADATGTVVDAPSFWTWAYKVGLDADAKAYVEASGGVKVVREREAEARGEMENSGICPVCGERQKLRAPAGKDPFPRMFQHGYRLSERGGWGFRAHGQQVGECYGSGKPPWETSPRGLIHFRDNMLLAWLERAREVEERYAAEGATAVKMDYDFATRKEVRRELRPGDLGYEDAIEHNRRESKRRRESLEADVERAEKMISEWRREDLYDERKAGKRLYPDVDPLASRT